MSDKSVDVTDTSFAGTVLQAPGSVLVDFWAAWSGPCTMMAPHLEEAAAQYAGRLTIAKLNIDHNPATGPQYDVEAIPALLLFNDGKVTATHFGALSKKQLTQFIDANL
ncbi:thioredoxin TrxA [Streptomyces sp. NPDC020965]|uniref:thioredoxin TrxA n=1 Tax=Streptomyces sp. NPDC020965 TaxID=3365105 RepID=UPI00378E9D14